MDKIAEKLSGWFGSTPFILFHVIWFGVWVGLHYTLNFDQDWELLTLVVSLEAIFLSLFILRAENIQAKRTEGDVKKDLAETRKIHELLKNKKK